MSDWIRFASGSGGFERPWALLLAALPVLLLLTTRLLGRPRQVKLGTIALLGQEQDPQEAQDAKRVRWPLWMLLVAGGAVWASIALAGPGLRLPGARGTATLHVMLDRSWTLDAGGRFSPPTAVASTRLARALAAAEPWRARAEELGLEIEWTASGGRRLAPDLTDEERLEQLLSACLTAGSSADATLSGPGAAGSEAATLLVLPHVDSLDLPVGQSGPAVLAIEAPQADGPIARGADAAVAGAALVLQAGQILERETPLSGHVVLEPGVPARAAELTRAWAAARGLTEDASNGPALLRLRMMHGTGAGTGYGTGKLVRGGREGFGVRVTLGAGDASPVRAAALAGRAWLTDDRGEPIVLARAGEIGMAPGAWEWTGSDPLAFPAAWVRLLDEHVAQPPEIVGVAQRRASSGLQRFWLEQLEDRVGADERRSATGACALIVALLLGAAVAALRRT